MKHCALSWFQQTASQRGYGRIHIHGDVTMRTETIRLVDSYRGIHEISRQLDSTNIKILTAMAKLGPRNLLTVSQQCGIPFATVRRRISQIEAKSKQVAILNPSVAKLGLIRSVMLATAIAGEEDTVTQALKIPNLWRVVERCEGAFTHHAIQLVPSQHLKSFNDYIASMTEMGLIKNHILVLAGDSIPNFPDFSSYNSSSHEWTFSWGEWLGKLESDGITRTITDPSVTGLGHDIDKTDLKIIESLELNVRMDFASIARDIGVSAQTVNDRYEGRLLPSGVVEYFTFDVSPYPLEISALHEVMLRFTSDQSLNRFFSLVEKLFFVVNVAKVLRENTLFVRTLIPNRQLRSMFEFFSQMAKADLIESYSAVRLGLAHRYQQTISSELFDNETRSWTCDLQKISY